MLKQLKAGASIFVLRRYSGGGARRLHCHEEFTPRINQKHEQQQCQSDFVRDNCFLNIPHELNSHCIIVSCGGDFAMTVNTQNKCRETNNSTLYFPITYHDARLLSIPG